MAMGDKVEDIERAAKKAVREELEKLKAEIGSGAKKLQPEQHLRYICNTIDRHLGELNG